MQIWSLVDVKRGFRQNEWGSERVSIEVVQNRREPPELLVL